MCEDGFGIAKALCFHLFEIAADAGKPMTGVNNTYPFNTGYNNFNTFFIRWLGFPPSLN